jgi:hypothetical protein
MVYHRGVIRYLPGKALEGDRMAEKYAVLIKYKYLEYIESAKLSDADAWIFMKGVIEYDKARIEPVYTNPVLSGLFAAIKVDLDQNRRNYEAVSEERSKAGKEGAKKRWGNGENSNCQKNQKIMAKMHGSGNDLDYGNGFENSTTIADSCESAIAANIVRFQNECERLGFKTDRRGAKSCLKKYAKGFENPADTHIFERLYGLDGFMEYVATYIHKHKEYSHKPQDQKQSLFFSLIPTEDKYNEYVDVESYTSEGLPAGLRFRQ